MELRSAQLGNKQQREVRERELISRLGRKKLQPMRQEDAQSFVKEAAQSRSAKFADMAPNTIETAIG